MNIKNLRQPGSSPLQLQTSENLTLALQLYEKGVIGLRQVFRHEGITNRIRTEVENLVIWSVKKLGAARISSNIKHAVPGSNPLTVNVHASHRSAIAFTDYSCPFKYKKMFQKK